MPCTPAAERAVSAMTHDAVDKVVDGIISKETGANRARRRKSLRSKVSEEFHQLAMDRLEDYQTAAPWHLYPSKDYGRRISLFLMGTPKEDFDDILQDQLSKVFDEILDGGFSIEIAQRWSDVIEDAVWEAGAEALICSGRQVGQA